MRHRDLHWSHRREALIRWFTVIKKNSTKLKPALLQVTVAVQTLMPLKAPPSPLREGKPLAGSVSLGRAPSSRRDEAPRDAQQLLEPRLHVPSSGKATVARRHQAARGTTVAVGGSRRGGVASGLCTYTILSAGCGVTSWKFSNFSFWLRAETSSAARPDQEISLTWRWNNNGLDFSRH